MSHSSSDWFKELNHYGSLRKPCYFVVDFLGEKGVVLPENNTRDFCFDFSGTQSHQLKTLKIKPSPIEYEVFKKAFDKVDAALHRGDSYLINLTFSTPIDINYGLKEIFQAARAKYKILHQNQWVCFSPEPFIVTQNNLVYTFPMKGTIDANLPHAKKLLLENPKELAEHFTIVDLLRNDLSKIAEKVKVNRFRFIERIQKHQGAILQASSEIQGTLQENWQDQMGDSLKELLPAGSISGAPKVKTLEVIQAAESHQRGYYTGIAGHFDGENLNTAVMIRFIEEKNGQKYFKSGGGITAQSNALEEYEEIQHKIYIPS